MFLPILMAHQIFDAQLVWHALLAFVSFGLIASATFLINDLVDIEADRKHPTKRFRPLAAGILKIAHAKVAIPILLAGSVGLAFAMFLFFSLALLKRYLKRYAEPREAGDAVGLRGMGRSTQAGDLETLS